MSKPLYHIPLTMHMTVVENLQTAIAELGFPSVWGHSKDEICDNFIGKLFDVAGEEHCDLHRSNLEELRGCLLMTPHALLSDQSFWSRWLQLQLTNMFTGTTDKSISQLDSFDPTFNFLGFEMNLFGDGIPRISLSDEEFLVENALYKPIFDWTMFETPTPCLTMDWLFETEENIDADSPMSDSVDATIVNPLDGALTPFDWEKFVISEPMDIEATFVSEPIVTFEADSNMQPASKIEPEFNIESEFNLDGFPC